MGEGKGDEKAIGEFRTGTHQRFGGQGRPKGLGSVSRREKRDLTPGSQRTVGVTSLRESRLTCDKGHS